MSVICRVILIEQLSLKLFWRRKWNHIKYCAPKGKNLFVYLQDREYGVTKLCEIYICKPDDEKKESKVWACREFRFLAGNGNHYFFSYVIKELTLGPLGASMETFKMLCRCFSINTTDTMIYLFPRIRCGDKVVDSYTFFKTRKYKPPMASPRGRPLKGKARNRREGGGGIKARIHKENTGYPIVRSWLQRKNLARTCLCHSEDCEDAFVYFFFCPP